MGRLRQITLIRAVLTKPAAPVPGRLRVYQAAPLAEGGLPCYRPVLLSGWLSMNTMLPSVRVVALGAATGSP